MGELQRLRLTSKRREASSLLAVESTELLASLEADAAWWTCSDEGDLDEMMSIVGRRGREWFIEPVELAKGSKPRTDAEALARIGEHVFVIGSNFTTKSGKRDERRAFITRFVERSIDGRVEADTLDLGSGLVDRALDALDRTPLLDAKSSHDAVNVEGAAFIDDALVIGLRWPVSADGQPLLLRFAGAREILSGTDWSVDAFLRLDATVITVNVGATPKRPAGVRAMTTHNRALHLVVGQTERDRAKGKTKPAAARHLQADWHGEELSVVELQRFEGFRRVEGLAPDVPGGWLYALDDEDAVVLLRAGEAEDVDTDQDG